MSDERRTRSFYRVAKSFPPTDADYRTQRDFRGDPSPDLSEEESWSWDAYSAFDSEAGARRQGQRIPRLGSYIVRYDIPENAGIEWRKTFGPGHYDLKGDKEELHRYLSDVYAEFEPSDSRGSRRMHYELWDVATGNCIGRYATEAEALRRVQQLVSRFGRDYAGDLEMTVEDERGECRGSRTGPDLLTRVDAVLLPPQVPTIRAG